MDNMNKKIIIIGAGIAGLSAGCYLQMNGYNTEIFEMHNLPGGLCTSWKRKGYTFDGCLHWLVGSSPKHTFYKFWEELGAVQDKKMVDHEEFMRYEDKTGKTLIFYTNIDKLEKHLKELVPVDIPIIEEICNAVRLFTKFDAPDFYKPRELMGLLDLLKLLFFIKDFIKDLGKYSKISIKEFSKRFNDPFLQDAIPLSLGLYDMSMLVFILTLAWLNSESAGYPIGGSLEFSRSIEKRYLGLGGNIHYKSKVQEILVENDKAVGIKLTNGTEYHGDLIISAADGHATIFDMLDGKYINEKIKKYYDTFPIFPPIIQVSIGVNRDLSKEPHRVTKQLKEPVIIADAKQETIWYQHYCYDPTLAPKGKSVIVFMFNANYEYWNKLYQNSDEYKAEKNKVANIAINYLKESFPDIENQVEVVDVATPMTYVRYTNNWQGSFEGWQVTPKTFGVNMSKTLPKLNNFYMIGQWVEPGGGLPGALISGRGVAQIICHKDKKQFETNIP